MLGFRLCKFLLISIGLLLGIVFILAYPLRFSRNLVANITPVFPTHYRPSATSLALKPSTSSTMTASGFRKPPQVPPTFTGTPKSIVGDTKKLIEKSRAVQDKIVEGTNTEQANFNNVFLPMAHDENDMGLETRILGFYQAVSTDKALRDASTEADKLLDEFGIECAMREDVYKLVDAVYRKKENLDSESQRLLWKEQRGFIRSGLGLPAGSKRDRFKEIKQKLSKIAIQFQKTLNEENGGIWFTREELRGVPQDVLSTLVEGEGENSGRLRLTFKYPDLFPTLKYATDPATRLKVFLQNANKCNENVPLFKEAVLLRDEAARLLGYPNHAAFRIENKMAKTPKVVDDFLGDLRTRLTKGGEEEVKVLKALKKEDLESKGQLDAYDGHYYAWDHHYYSRLLLERDYQLDQQMVAEYFPLQTTLESMLRIFTELLGLVFVEVVGEDRAAIAASGNGDDIVWHPDVQIFSVWNDEGEGSEFVGYLYTDLHPRDGKYVWSSSAELYFPTYAALGTVTRQTSTFPQASRWQMALEDILPPHLFAISASQLHKNRVCSSMMKS